ncbi:hypothetical protein [Thermomonospora catenispora]|uniref:hypothetical protein n=1 Tax=Thermomonospora catenispora TaxID=2493090 RepID=UPI00111E9CB3|nr:hypothetical protein [Thermomonospora catenispora]TNY37086.1 hypothetical protein EIO00_09565 [Thermomonospora catenispora]
MASRARTPRHRRRTSRSRRRSRRRRRGAGRLGGALSALLGLTATAGLLAALDAGASLHRQVAHVTGPSPMPPATDRPAAGRPVTVATPEGDRYTMAAVRTGVERAPLPGLPAPPPGKGYAFADYVLTNPHHRPLPLVFPPGLLLRRTAVPAEHAERCVFRFGAPERLCEPPGRSRVIARLRGSQGPIRIGSGVHLAPRSSCLVRVVADAPVPESLDRGDMALYVWRVRFTGDGIARRIPLPEDRAPDG